MKVLIEDYTSLIVHKTPFGLAGENGLQMVRIAVAMQEASRTKKAVRTG
jgi:hypothetical protein